MKFVIGCFADALLQDIDAVAKYKINGICGIGSNGFVMKATDESDTSAATVALKLLNVSYFIKHFYSFDESDSQTFAFDHLDGIEESLSNLSITRVKTGQKGINKLTHAEQCSFKREFYALQRIPKNDKVAFLIDHGFLEIHVSDNHRAATYTFPYLVMPFFSGTVLTSYADSCKFNLGKTIEISAQIIKLIEFIHKYGIIHRDLYPNNFLYDETTNSVKLIDFGSAAITGLKNLDVNGERRGARRFMSPEQFKNASACDEISDLFFLGSDMFYLFSGETPFDRTRNGDTHPKNLHDIINCPEGTAVSYFLDSINKTIHYDQNHRITDLNAINTAIIHLKKIITPTT